MQDASGQDLSGFRNRKPFKLTGSFLTSEQYNSANVRNPFVYLAGANLNVDFYGWSIPLSFTFSNRGYAFQQPFNQYGVSPTYKWITLHTGYRSMNFSDFTYAGLPFYGVGMEISPDIGVRISAFYGRLKKAVLPDTTRIGEEGSFKRTGYGIKVEYSKPGFSINTILFKAEDDKTSLAYIPTDNTITPQENLALGVGGNVSIIKGLTISLELSSSALSADTRSPQSTDAHGLYAKVGGIFAPRTSSDYFIAGKAGIMYSFPKSSIGLNYERVNPGYKTLGGYYFNEDLENYTFSFAHNFLVDKLIFSMNMGYERNNLDKSNANETSRLVLSGNLGFTPSKNWNFYLSYSNFKTHTNSISPNSIQDPMYRLDTLNYRQVSQSASLGMVAALPATTGIKKILNISANIQSSGNDQSSEAAFASSNYSEAISYQVNFLEREISLTTAVNSIQAKTAAGLTTRFGYNVSVGRSLLKRKWRISILGGYDRSLTEERSRNSAFNLRFSNNLALNRKNNLNIDISYRKSGGSAPKRGGDVAGNILYASAF